MSAWKGGKFLTTPLNVNGYIHCYCPHSIGYAAEIGSHAARHKVLVNELSKQSDTFAVS
jgi:hypothetical protein